MNKEKRTRNYRLIQPSTRAFFKEARKLRDYNFFDALHGYIYGRWPYLYIGIGTGQHPAAKKLGPIAKRIATAFQKIALLAGSDGEKSKVRSTKASSVTFADTYHGKVVTLGAAKELITVKEEIRLDNLEHVIPYARARDIVLKNPDHIAVLECPCRSGRENPCKPLDVCLIVGEPFTSFITEHHPQKSRWITPEEAVAILEAEDERGHVHHAFFKDAMLGRYYAICNCCSCCCGAIQAHQSGTPMLAASGYFAVVDEAICISCENCIEYCQFDALAVSDSGFMSVDNSKCMGCGICISKCTSGAISLERSTTGSAPLEIYALLQKANNDPL